MNINIYDSKINQNNGLPNPPTIVGDTRNVDIQDIEEMIRQGKLTEAIELLTQAGIEVKSNTEDGVTIVEFKYNNQARSVRYNPPSDDVEDTSSPNKAGGKNPGQSTSEEEILGRFAELWSTMQYGKTNSSSDSQQVARMFELFKTLTPDDFEKALKALGAKDIGTRYGSAFLNISGPHYAREFYGENPVFSLHVGNSSIVGWINGDSSGNKAGTMTLEEYFNSPQGAWLKTPEELVNEYKNNPCDDTNMFENGAFAKIVEYFGMDKAQEYLDAYKDAFFDESKGDYFETIELNGEKYFRLSFNGEEHCYDKNMSSNFIKYRGNKPLPAEPSIKCTGYDNPVISQLSNDEGKTIGELNLYDWLYDKVDEEGIAELFKILYKNGAEYTVSYTADNKYAILDVKVNGETAQITMPKDFYSRYSLEFHMPETRPAALSGDTESPVDPTSHKFTTEEFNEIMGVTSTWLNEQPTVPTYVKALSDYMGFDIGDWNNKRENMPIVSAKYIMEFLTTGHIDNWMKVEEFQSDNMEYQRQTVYAALSAILKSAGVENVDKIDFDNLKNENIEQQLGVSAGEIEQAINNLFKDMSFGYNDACYGYNLFVYLYENGYDDKYFEDYINTHINKQMLDQMVVDQVMGNGIETKVPEMEEVVNAGLDIQQTVGQDVADSLVSEDGVHIDDDSVEEALEQAKEELKAELEDIAKDAGVEDVDAFVDNMVEDVKDKIDTIRAYFEAIIHSNDTSVPAEEACFWASKFIIWHNDVGYDTDYKCYGRELRSVMRIIQDYFRAHPIKNIDELNITDCIRYFFNRYDFNSAVFAELFSDYSIGFNYADLLKVIFDRYTNN